MSLTRAPESHQTLSRDWAQSVYWVLGSPWKGITYNHNPCFIPLGSCCNMRKYMFLIVVTPLALPDFHPLHPLAGLPCTKAHNFCADAPHWGSKVGEEWFCLYPKHELHSIYSFLCNYYLLAGGWTEYSLDLAFFLVVALVSWRPELGSTSLSAFLMLQYSLTFPLHPAALLPGWEGYPPAHIWHNCYLCYNTVENLSIPYTGCLDICVFFSKLCLGHCILFKNIDE